MIFAVNFELFPGEGVNSGAMIPWWITQADSERGEWVSFAVEKRCPESVISIKDSNNISNNRPQNLIGSFMAYVIQAATE